MATIILTAVGGALGGPLGGAIGAFAGQLFDQNILFKPKDREGPRLQELAVQTSSYGTQIPRIYGQMRVAGTVIWATDLKEVRNVESRGKGRPGTAIYSYFASFAVALSSRRIKRIGRIWADGKIFRGRAGDFKTPCTFRWQAGEEDQPVDPYIASAEAARDNVAQNGAAATPAYRGLALAIFEDMDLAEYGNRIPSLSFELIADRGAVAVAEIINDISAGSISLDASQKLIGFAASGSDRRAILAILSETLALGFAVDKANVIGSELITAYQRHHHHDQSVHHLNAGLIMAADHSNDHAPGDVASSPGPEFRMVAESKLPRRLALRYYEPARDYQASMQDAFRPGTARIVVHRDFPAALDAAGAKQLAFELLWTGYQERETVQVEIAQSSRSIGPGTLVTLSNHPATWRVRECEYGRGKIRLSLSRFPSFKAMHIGAPDHGRVTSDRDQRAGITRLMLVDLPFALEQPGKISDVSRLYAVAAGDIGWRNSQCFRLDDDGEPGDFVGNIPAPSVIGQSLNILGGAQSAYIDCYNHIDIMLHNPAMSLQCADRARLIAGANIAMLGDELIQFGHAAPRGAGKYRLSELIRGLGGTEAAIIRHQAGENFIILDRAAALEIANHHYALFAAASFCALGRDDVEPVMATIANVGRALRPWSPVHPKWILFDDSLSRDSDSLREDGLALKLSWTRRSRAGGPWHDHADVPLAEEFERYLLVLGAETTANEGGPAPLIIETDQPMAVISAAQLQIFRAMVDPRIAISISQIGRHGPSDPCLLRLRL